MEKNMKIGSKEVVHTAALLIPENEESWIYFTIGTWNVIVKVIFSEPNDNSETQVQITPESDYAKVSFINWNNSLGTTTVEPVQLGTTSDQKYFLKFMALVYKIANVYKLDIQFLLEEIR